MNNITVVGNLTRDSEKRFLPSGEAVVSFGVADNQGRDAQGNDKPPIYWTCSFFGKRGEAVQPYLIKGQAVTVIGAISERERVDKEGGQRKTMEIRVTELALQGGARQQGGQGQARSQEQYSDDEVPAQPRTQSQARPVSAARPGAANPFKRSTVAAGAPAPAAARTAPPARAPSTQVEDDDIPF